MKHLLVSVFDSKVGAFSQPFFVRTKGEAIRSFTDAVKDSGTMFAKHPADYRLYVIGEFDDNDGRLIGSGNPEPLIGADEVEKPLG